MERLCSDQRFTSSEVLLVLGQVVWAVVVAVLLPAVSVGWAIRGAITVREWLIPPRERATAKPLRPVQPELLRFLSQRRMILANGFLLAFSFLFLMRSMDRGLSLMGAVVLAFAYAVMSATITGFTVWVRAQQRAQYGRPRTSATFRWPMWVGVGIGVFAALYLLVEVVGNLVG